MDKESAIAILKKTGVMQEGHFKLTSGRHSDKYMQCAKLFVLPDTAALMSKALAEKFTDTQIDLVVGPAIGGIILAYEVARQLGVANIFAERQEGVMTFRRGFTVEPGARVLVVEDVVTTGGSVKEVINLAESFGAEVVGVGAIVDRSNGAVDFGRRFEAVLSMEVVSYPPEECPICKTGMPLSKPGSRIKFKE